MATLCVIIAGLLLLSCGCVSSSSSSSSSSSGRPFQSHDLKPQEMRALLGQPVVRMRMVERPLDGYDTVKGIVSHSGVEVVTEDGRRFLIHKGSDYGGGNAGGNTVVVDAKHMSKKWTPASNWKVPNEKTRVTDMVKAGGKDYNMLFDNCHDASKNAMYGNKKGFVPIFKKPQVKEEDKIPNEERKVTGILPRKQENTAGSLRTASQIKEGGSRKAQGGFKNDQEVLQRDREGARRGNEVRTGGSRMGLEARTGDSRRGHEGSRRGHEGSRRGHEGSRRGHEGSRKRIEFRTGGSRPGHEVKTGDSRRGHEVKTGGSRRGHEVRTGGSRRGHEVRTGGSRRGHEVKTGGYRRGHEVKTGGSRRGHEVKTGGSRRGHEVRTGGSRRGHEVRTGGSRRGHEARTGNSRRG